MTSSNRDAHATQPTARFLTLEEADAIPGGSRPLSPWTIAPDRRRSSQSNGRHTQTAACNRSIGLRTRGYDRARRQLMARRNKLRYRDGSSQRSQVQYATL
jgi:hypothetical protein